MLSGNEICRLTRLTSGIYAKTAVNFIAREYNLPDRMKESLQIQIKVEMEAHYGDCLL